MLAGASSLPEGRPVLQVDEINPLKSIVVALFAAAAFAAASPAVAAEPSIPTPAASWTGFYGGLDVGYNWAQSATFVPGSPTAGTAEPHPDSVSLGGHMGYLHQFLNPVVLGIEADASWLDGNASRSFPADPIYIMKPKTNWDGSVRGILGVPVMKSLLYATGGWAWTSVEGCGVKTKSSPSCFTDTRYSKALSGWTVGVGAASPLPVLHGAIARIEYLHSDFGTATVTNAGYTGGTANIDVKSDKLRFGLSWPIGKP